MVGDRIVVLGVIRDVVPEAADVDLIRMTIATVVSLRRLCSSTAQPKW